MNVFNNLPVALDIANLLNYISVSELSDRSPVINLYSDMLRGGTCLGSDFCGWLSPDQILDAGEYNKLKETAAYLRENTDVLLVIGIGGSYLGARAVIEALADDPEKVVYAGQNISAHYIKQLKTKLSGKRVAINVVSKSGTTTEPAIALRLFKELSDSCEMLVATTDKEKGALLDFSKKLGIKSFVVPSDIGGRYSVLSAVGLLPIAYAGIDIDALINGASKSAKLCSNPDPKQNPAYAYAAIRNILSQKGYGLEILSSFEPRLFYIAEWWKQLFGESEGKNGTGIFPASCTFSTDLHSLGQFIQEGKRNLFETFLVISEGEPSVTVPRWDDDSDGMNYLAGEEISYINNMAYEATAKAHTDGKVPNMTIRLETLDAYSLGALLYFYEISCAMTCLMAGVNPFNQPGVEAYKKYMFRLLGKPSYDKLVIDDSGKHYITF